MLDQRTFDLLLKWLGPDRERGGQKYEEIRRRLIRFFECRGVAYADELADETINRVSRRLPEIICDYSGNPASYFYGVANKVHLEYLKKNASVELPAALPAPEPDEQVEEKAGCLDECLGRMTPQNRELMLEYYCGSKQEKIDGRKSLAARLGIGQNALRIRAYRLRLILQTCVFACLEQKLD